MNRDDSPFLSFNPAFEDTVLAFSHAAVDGNFTWEQHQHIPRSNLIFNNCATREHNTYSGLYDNEHVFLEIHRLRLGTPASSEVIDSHVSMLPLVGGQCFGLPVSFLKSKQAHIITGLDSGMHFSQVHDEDKGWLPDLIAVNDDMRKDKLNELATALHTRLGVRFDTPSMTLGTEHCKAIACVCHDDLFHFRLFVVVFDGKREAALHVWDPMQGWVSTKGDAQVAQAARILQRLLPNNIIVPSVSPRQPKAEMLRSKLFSQLQPAGDSTECGMWCSRAITHLVMDVDFDTDIDHKEAMRRYRVWLVACLAQGSICL